MNQSTTSRRFGAAKVAKLVLFKLIFLSTASLFAQSALAITPTDDAPITCLEINKNLSRYVSSYGYFLKHDYVDWNNEWILTADLRHYPTPAYRHLPKKDGLTTFQLKSIKIKTVPFTLKDANGDDNVNHPIIESVSCEYQDPNFPGGGSLSLTLKPSGKIRVGDTSLVKDVDGNEVTDRTVSYVSNAGSITAYKSWEYDKKADVVEDFTCSDMKTNCGGWNFQRVVQNNGFWSDAFAKCQRRWIRCHFYLDPGFVNWTYAVDLMNKSNTMKWDEGSHFCAYTSAIIDGNGFVQRCRVLNASKAYCENAKCTNEIEDINKIIGTNPTDPAKKDGMGHYVRACWADPNLKLVWQRKKWDAKYENCDSRMNPVVSWPDYRHLGLPG